MSHADQNKEKPLALELLEPADYGQYLLRNHTEILHVLRQLQQHQSQITLFFNEGGDLLLTTLLAADERHLVFDYGASEATNQRALNAEKLFCITQLDKVRIQFVVRGMQGVAHEGRPAFRAPFPDTLLRLQRREYFRLVMPVTRRLVCQIPVNGERIEVDVVDLSGGGVAVMVPPSTTKFHAGMKFPGCRIELQDVGVVNATIEVMSIFELTMRNGAHVKRAGCRFVDLSPAVANLIPRYIIRMERERKAREAGLA